MTNGQPPDYSLFVEPRSRWRRFVQALAPGVPTRVDGIADARGSQAQQIATYAKESGFRVVLRTIDGTVWACRLRPEDAEITR